MKDVTSYTRMEGDLKPREHSVKEARHGKGLKSYEQYYPARENGLEVIFLIDWKGWDWLSCRRMTVMVICVLLWARNASQMRRAVNQ